MGEHKRWCRIRYSSLLSFARNRYFRYLVLIKRAASRFANDELYEKTSPYWRKRSVLWVSVIENVTFEQIVIVKCLFLVTYPIFDISLI